MKASEQAPALSLIDIARIREEFRATSENLTLWAILDGGIIGTVAQRADGDLLHLVLDHASPAAR